MNGPDTGCTKKVTSSPLRSFFGSLIASGSAYLAVWVINGDYGGPIEGFPVYVNDHASHHLLAIGAGAAVFFRLAVRGSSFLTSTLGFAALPVLPSIIDASNRPDAHSLLPFELLSYVVVGLIFASFAAATGWFQDFLGRL